MPKPSAKTYVSTWTCCQCDVAATAQFKPPECDERLQRCFIVLPHNDGSSKSTYGHRQRFHGTLTPCSSTLHDAGSSRDISRGW
ncbi:hypothetical protein CFIO01_08011 [Colletotrichum fioriniae PJ7]|uniref:Uncharacterized protein n=1 Tax=Colletotrichum fioriniae PJ7 TaxID=1445577 RepID=A0A010QYN0_9PEZI|nr:hypothetical protein CFIO01_08011 [Colletotrichum fioriniae PJ7]